MDARNYITKKELLWSMVAEPHVCNRTFVRRGPAQQCLDSLSCTKENTKNAPIYAATQFFRNILRKASSPSVSDILKAAEAAM